MSDQASSLLDLPPELRQRIWDLALPASPDDSLFPALLQVCRLIREEGSTLFYGRQRYRRPVPLVPEAGEQDLCAAASGPIEVQVSFPHGINFESLERFENGVGQARQWWEKLNVTAVECCEEGVELGAPPFPFKQRWDRDYEQLRRWKKKNEFPQKKARGRKGRGKKGGRGGYRGGFESFDE